MVIISLYDFTGIACEPWARAGHDCYCFDKQHAERRTVVVGNGSVTFVPWDADDAKWFATVADEVAGRPVAQVMGFPPCDDLAGSGAKHWATKLAKDPECQETAVRRVKRVPETAERLECDNWVLENPVGALTRLWRKFNHTFNPCFFGGYLPKGDKHPKYPEYIPPRDRYNKLTCLWVGPDYRFPKFKKVKPEIIESVGKDGRRLVFNRQTQKLGGKSLKTKNIRSATPRGWALANQLANDL